MNTNPAETLAHTFTPLYSYQLPAWWQTTYGICGITAGGILVGLLVGYAIWYRFWYKPPLTLEQWTMRELNALKTLLNRHPINYKRFFGAATFFFKQYLVKLYGWNVMDKTDDELYEFIANQPHLPRSLHSPIKELLSYAQVVKFADAQALAEKAEEAEEYLKMLTKELTKTKKI
jgi:hypothetical protein